MSDLVKFQLEITTLKRWVDKFIQMLECMRRCSRSVSSRVVAFYADGESDIN